jgi:polyhydroxybutyrate depolymerase
MKKILLILLCLPMFGFGQQTFNFMHNGLNREYIYYAPANLQVDAPLVFVAHGFTGSAQGIMNYCGMNTIADQNGFAVCYPQGTIDSWGDNFWNVGYDFHAGVTVDDVDFIVSLASYLQSTHQLSTTNTFFTGMSNGAEMCYLLACEGPNIFRAFAPVAGTIFPNGLTNNICSPGIPVPIFETHGRNDNITLIQGDPFDQFWGPYLSIDTIIDFWVDQNSLTNLIVDTFPNLNNNNKITISYKFSDPITNNEVWLYTHKSGHNWGDDGDIVIEQEIWDFFNQMSLSTSTSIQEHPIKNKLIKVVDILGRETEKVRNTLLFYIYDDGTVDKQIIFNK